MTNEKCYEIAKILQDCSNVLIIGKGSSLSICKEGALKIKECTYIHAEAIGGSELKHGPLALIDSD